MKKLPPLIAVVGTNASGKSGLAVELAKRFAARSYPPIPGRCSVGWIWAAAKSHRRKCRACRTICWTFASRTSFFPWRISSDWPNAAIDAFTRAEKLPFLAGGTGLYVDSVADGYVLSEVKPDLRYREHLETFTTPELYQMLTSSCLAR